ncbi:SGNH/GDSL hydrolase family protein [Spiroplasma cantharicola]|uniref:Lipolytic enzyme, GDSL family n=1 Tax=Spiroplasma cantharicola TaxID=362837 RepID=A0A0M5KCI4_9MOLU|nr:SGNH/GDSL hydrolase family protein [Spiroplasma cantharicola]ALD66281.1 lipolytic enzyme, GDSL family [Spiroplasma cantharicola]
MKKLLSLLTVVSFSISTVTSTVSCMPKQPSTTKTSPLKIGLDIDKSQTIDTTSDPKNHFGFTNYFIVGDSLSDVNGLTTYVKDKFVVNTNLDQFIDFNLTLGGAYGFEDENGVYNSAFSNGKTTGYLLSEKLNFGGMRASNKYSKLVNSKEGYGKNYSVGGATAGKTPDLTTGLVINDFSTEEQARALVKQQKIGSNDLVFFEIGGNDMFSLIQNQDSENEKALVEYMNESIKSIRATLFTLLNNGIKNILFMGPPIMDIVPRYLNREEKQDIVDLGKEYEIKINKVVNEVKSYYPDSLFYTSLYEGENDFPTIIKGYGEYIDKEIENEYNSTSPFAETNVVEINGNTTFTFNELKAIDYKKYIDELKESSTFEKTKLNVTLKAQPSNVNQWNDLTERDQIMKSYFFTDVVHPTKFVHEYVSEIIKEMVLREFK